MERWMEYVEELFDDVRNDDPIKTFLCGPEIMEEEVEICLNRMKSGKAQGIDGITADMLKGLGEFGISTLTQIYATKCMKRLTYRKTLEPQYSSFCQRSQKQQTVLILERLV